MCVGYTVHMLMIVLQYNYNFINVQCTFFHAGWPNFEKGVIGKNRGVTYKE